MAQSTKLCQTIVLALILLVSVATAGRISRLNRISREAETEEVCRADSPCGWAVLKPSTRKVDYFMKNTCVCSKDMACIRTGEDLSISALVYHCREPSDATEN